MFDPSEQPQPLLCGMAATPSTFGNFAREYSENSASIAICCDSWLAHMLVGTTSTMLRDPTRPSARRKPRNVRRRASGTYAGGGVGKSVRRGPGRAAPRCSCSGR